MPACEACHRSKVRCNQQQYPCTRCSRLGIECVKRISKQGQGPKPRNKRKQQPEDLDSTSNENSTRKRDPSDNLKKKNARSEDETLCEHLERFGKHHFGVLYLIHSWISFAFARRSFELLGRASRLAACCGVSMDEIFSPQRRHILDPILWPSTTAQQELDSEKLGTPLRWSDLPDDLLKTCLATGKSPSRSQRYIFIREAKNGQSRFLLSEAFQRDICSQWLIEQTWRANEKPVVQVFLEGQDDFDKFTNAVQYQMSRYTHPGRPVECVRVNRLRVKMAGESGDSSNVQEMDLVYAFEIVTLEHSYYLSELVFPKRQTVESDMVASVQDENLECTSLTSTDFMDLFDDLDDLVVDQDLEAFVSFINGGDT